MNLFAGEQMPDHVESTIDDSTDDDGSKKTYINQLKTQMNNKRCY